MPIYTKESLENLRQKIDLIELLSSHIDLKRAGAAYKALCPFHDEKSPSFMVQRGDTHYHCFGCGAHGDAIQFLMAHVKMSFTEAVESLAQKFHVHLEKIEGQGEALGVNKTKLKEALELAASFYHYVLLHTEEGHEALKYLFNRGIDLDFIKAFQIGLAPKAPGLLRKVMHEKGFTNEMLIEAGLLASTEKGVRDFFSERITFPIHNSAGAVIGFSARKYHEQTFGGKYVNTPETALFKKSRVLFGLNYSRKRIAKERKAIIVEGQIDALRLIYAGFNITVAGQGTAFGEGHVKELMVLGVNCVYLALDADNAGQEAAAKIGNLFQKEGVEVKILSLPRGADPDSFLREKGAEAFLQLMNESIDYLTFLVRQESGRLDVNSPAGKNELIRRVVKVVRAWDNQLMVHESLRKLAHLMQVPEHMVGVGQEVVPNIYIRRQDTLGLESVDPSKRLESDFLSCLLLMGDSHPQLAEMSLSHVTPAHLRLPVSKKLYSQYIENKKQKLHCDLISLAIGLDTHDQELMGELLQKKFSKERVELHMQETVQKILDRHWMEKREEIKMKLQSGNCSDDEASALAKQFSELKRQQVADLSKK